MGDVAKELDELEMWSKTFVSTVCSAVAQIKKAIDPSEPAPTGELSRAELAHVIFQDVEKRFSDIQLCMEEARKAIQKAG